LNYRTAQQESGGEIGHQEPVSLRVPSSSEYALLTRLVISSVGEASDFAPEDIYDLKLAVTEAVTNVIRHAAVDSMKVDYRSLPGVVEVTVTDAGGGFDVAELNREPGEAGGFGLAVIRNLVDEVVLDSTGRGTTIKMVRYAAKDSS
jgi:serine/threonine-protein kinase RsbW